MCVCECEGQVGSFYVCASSCVSMHVSNCLCMYVCMFINHIVLTVYLSFYLSSTRCICSHTSAFEETIPGLYAVCLYVLCVYIYVYVYLCVCVSFVVSI